MHFLKNILLQTVNENKEVLGHHNKLWFHDLISLLKLTYEQINTSDNLDLLAEELANLRVFHRIKKAVEERDLEKARELLKDIGSDDTYDEEGNLVPDKKLSDIDLSDQELSDIDLSDLYDDSLWLPDDYDSMISND